MEIINTNSSSSSDDYSIAQEYYPSEIRIINNKKYSSIIFSHSSSTIIVNTISIQKIFSLIEIDWFQLTNYYKLTPIKSSTNSDNYPLRKSCVIPSVRKIKINDQMIIFQRNGVETINSDSTKENEVVEGDNHRLSCQPKRPKLKRRKTFVTVESTDGEKVKINKEKIDNYLKIISDGQGIKDEKKKKTLSLREVVLDFKKKKKEISPLNTCIQYLRNCYLYSLYDKETKYFMLNNNEDEFIKVSKNAEQYVSKRNLFENLNNNSNLVNQDNYIYDSNNKKILFNIKEFLFSKYSALKDLENKNSFEDQLKYSLSFNNIETYVETKINGEKKVLIPISQFVNYQDGKILDLNGEIITNVKLDIFYKINNELEYLYKVEDIKGNIAMFSKPLLIDIISTMCNKLPPSKLISHIQEIKNEKGEKFQVCYHELMKYKKFFDKVKKQKFDIQNYNKPNDTLYHLRDNETNSYFYIWNKEKNKKEFVNKKAIVLFIQNPKHPENKYNQYELKMAISKSNFYNEYYLVPNPQKQTESQFYKKIKMFDYMSLLYDNKSFPRFSKVVNESGQKSSIDTEIVVSNFKLTNKYYDILLNHKIKNGKTDVLLSIYIEDVYNESFKVKVPFLRKLLYEIKFNKINKKLNIIIKDEQGKQRIINPEKIILNILHNQQKHEKYNNVEQINSDLIFIEVKGVSKNSHLISKTQFDMLLKIHNNEQKIVEVFDAKNKKFVINLKNLDECKRKWIKVIDKDNKEFFIFSSIIEHINFEDNTDHIIEVYDFYSSKVIISTSQINKCLYKSSNSLHQKGGRKFFIFLK